GKYVAPQVLENVFKESPFIEQLLVVGFNEKFVAGIICPSFEYLNGWAFTNGIIYRDAHELINKKRVIERFQKEVDELNKRLSHHEQIKKFLLTCRDWTVETGELSPTLKLKRNYLKKKYKVKLDFIYGYTEDSGDLGMPDDRTDDVME
ncbi:MAG: long-chain fatty acid--CoA ligase, partial [Bacteroidota bacterium]|nr:long-chain fatty acid--CoA ligase [Bacteroidota bacterium]